ncbi:MAG TPA: AI-2E family transporter [Clostridiales bacterium]|jgi:predicted PurR-regulated permease PerM|nr:AI-2E family transporter [Clostridiales bacterium]
MKIPEKRKNIFWLMVFAAALLACALNIGKIIDIIKLILRAASPILAGLAIAFVLNVPLKLFENNIFCFIKKKGGAVALRICRYVSLVLTFVLVLGILFASLYFLIPQLISTVQTLISNSATFGENITAWLKKILSQMNVSETAIENMQLDWGMFVERLIGIIQASAAKLASYATNLTTSLLATLFDAVLAVVISIYVLMNKEKIKRFFVRFSQAFVPTKHQEEFFRIARLTNTMFSGFVRGQLLEAMILGMLCFAGMVLFKFPYATIISIFVTILALFPIVGSFISAGIGVFLMLTVSPIKALLFLIFILVLQQLEGNFIYPKVVGRTIGIPGVIIVSVVVLCGSLFGIMGILIGIPLSSVLYILLKEAINKRLEKQFMNENPS